MTPASVSPRPRERFEEVVRQHYERVYNFLYHMVGDQEEAADLTQDTFVNACAAYQEFRGQAGVYTWLCKIGRNLAINRLKRRELERRVAAPALEKEDGEWDQPALEIRDQSPGPDVLADRQEVKEQVRACLVGLPAEFREVIVLRDLQGFSYNEICEIVGCTLSALKSRLFRARGMLRDRLAPVLFPPGSRC